MTLCGLIEQVHNGKRLSDLQTLALDDQRDLRDASSTPMLDVSGVFQFESLGMRDVLRRHKPTAVRRPHGLERALSARAQSRVA